MSSRPVRSTEQVPEQLRLHREILFLKQNKAKLASLHYQTLGDCNASLSTIERSSRQKINGETLDVNDVMRQMGLGRMCRAFQPNTEGYVLYSAAHGSVSKIDHILGHKQTLQIQNC